MLVPVDGSRSESGLVRVAWSGAGLTCVAVGSLGIVVPGLPTTIFFIGAAACFTRSSPRLEAWVLGLPGVGQAVRDHRAGLGMPRRAKRAASAAIAGFAGLSAVLVGDGRIAAAIVFLGIVGICWIRWQVPTKEQVLAGRRPT